jgi:hypothetical protein
VSTPAAWLGYAEALLASVGVESVLCTCAPLHESHVGTAIGSSLQKEDRMSLSEEAQTIYQYLVSEVVGSGHVVTYGQVSGATGVPLGPEGQNPVVNALYEIFRACDAAGLPPLTVVVVQHGQVYGNGRHGMPGGGYLSAEARSLNKAGRRRDPGWERWGETPRPPDTDTWLMRAMIEAH